MLPLGAGCLLQTGSSAPQNQAHRVSSLPFAEGLQHWGEVENGGDGWKIEELPGDFGTEFPSEEVHKYFVTSFE